MSLHAYLVFSSVLTFLIESKDRHRSVISCNKHILKGVYGVFEVFSPYTLKINFRPYHFTLMLPQYLKIYI